jgi:hypothetical protein
VLGMKPLPPTARWRRIPLWAIILVVVLAAVGVALLVVPWTALSL